MSTMHFSPRRWFAPRETVSRRDDLPMMPARDEIDSFFQSMFNGMATPWEAVNGFLPLWRQRAKTGILPNLDLTSDEKAYALSIELPGVEPENVRLEVRDAALIIAGEKKRQHTDDEKGCHVLERVYGSFQRVLALPDDADADAITATHKNGVLTVAIPRRAPARPQAKAIEITRE